MRPPLLSPRAIMAGLVGLGLAASSTSHAQTTGTTQNIDITRVIRQRDADENVEVDRTTRRFWINYEECLAGDILRFVFDGSGLGIDNVKVYASASDRDCVDATNRDDSCDLLYDDAPSSEGSTGGRSVAIRAQDLVGATLPTYPGLGRSTAETCDEASGSGKLELTFIFESNDGTVATAVFSQSTADTNNEGVGVAVTGPDAPTGLTVKPGESRLILDWDSPDDESDIDKYLFYCEAATGAPDTTNLTGSVAAAIHIDGGPHDASAGGGAGGSATGGAGGTPSVGGTGATGAVAATGGFGIVGIDAGVIFFPDGGLGTGATGAVASDGGPTSGPTECGPSSTLIEGEPPDPAVVEPCGEIGSSLGDARTDADLSNNVKYRVAVAAVDNVGNVGPLSEVLCETPVIIDSFFELYKREGGAGGGGFCATSPRGGTGHALLGGWLLAVGAAVARRRVVAHRRRRAS